MSEIVVLDGELSLEVSMDGECGTYMQVGESPVVEALEVTENGTYTASGGVNGYSPVTVNVPTPEPSIESLTVTENGTYTAEGDGYNPVTVNVPTPEPVISSLSITENGTYTAPSGTDGYSPITVNVPSEEPVTETLTVTENGTYTPGAGIDGFNSVTVNVSGNTGWTTDGVVNLTEPSGDITTTLTEIPKNSLRYNTGVTIFRAPNATTIGATAVSNTSIQKMYFPLLTSVPSNGIQNNASLELVDFGALTSIHSNGCFYGSKLLTTFIIRTNSVCSISFGNTMTNCPIRTGTGTVYVPQSLIESYQTATGWSTCYANGTQFLAIEGSVYE